MENAFYFIVLKLFKILYCLFGHVEKSSLIRKIRWITKSMMLQPGWQTKLAKFNCLISWLLEIWDSAYIGIVCFQGCIVINLEITLISLIKLFFCMTKTQRQKIRCLRNKKILRSNWKHFSSFSNSFQLSKFVLDLRQFLLGKGNEKSYTLWFTE